MLSTLAVLERHFAGIHYAKGLESAKRMNFEDLLKRAKMDDIFNPEEESDLEGLRHLRNAYAHFREPLHKLSSVRRSIWGRGLAGRLFGGARACGIGLPRPEQGVNSRA